MFLENPFHLFCEFVAALHGQGAGHISTENFPGFLHHGSHHCRIQIKHMTNSSSLIDKVVEAFHVGHGAVHECLFLTRDRIDLGKDDLIKLNAI